MPPLAAPKSSVGQSDFKPLFDPDFKSRKSEKKDSTSKTTNKTDAYDTTGFSVPDSQEPNLKKLENARTTFHDPLEDFLKKHQDDNKPYILDPTPGKTIQVNPYVHQPRIEEFVEAAQTPLISTETVQKGIHLLAKTQPSTLMLDQLSHQLDQDHTFNPVKPLRQGIEKGVSEIISGMTSPQNIAIAGGTLLLSATPAEPYIGAVATTALVPATVISAKETVRAIQQGDLEEVGRRFAHTIVGGAGLLVSVKYGYLEEPKVNFSKQAVQLESSLISKELPLNEANNLLTKNTPVAASKVELTKLESIVKVDERKFGDYIFKEGATHGKDYVFKQMGYDKGQTENLAQIWQSQGAEKFKSGQYSLNKKDFHGQRITIEVELEGIGSSLGKKIYIKSGWLINPDQELKLVTPFSGFSR